MGVATIGSQSGGSIALYTGNCGCLCVGHINACSSGTVGQQKWDSRSGTIIVNHYLSHKFNIGLYS